MGRRLPDKVIHRIRIYIEASKAVLAITDAIKVAKKIIYKMQVTLIFGANHTRLLLWFKVNQEVYYLTKR